MTEKIMTKKRKRKGYKKVNIAVLSEKTYREFKTVKVMDTPEIQELKEREAQLKEIFRRISMQRCSIRVKLRRLRREIAVRELKKQGYEVD